MAELPHDPAPDLTRNAPPVRDLARLVQLSAAGDQQAFAALYDATSELSFGLAMRILGNASDAERVTHDAYLHAWTHAVRYDESQGSAISWITGLVHRRAVACVRLVGPRVGDAGAAGREASCPLAELPSQQRAAVERAYFDGRTCAEVARDAHVTVATAATRIRDGLLTLSPGASTGP